MPAGLAWWDNAAADASVSALVTGAGWRLMRPGGAWITIEVARTWRMAYLLAALQEQALAVRAASPIAPAFTPRPPARVDKVQSLAWNSAGNEVPEDVARNVSAYLGRPLRALVGTEGACFLRSVVHMLRLPEQVQENVYSWQVLLYLLAEAWLCANTTGHSCWRRNARSVLQQWCDSLLSSEKVWEISARLLQHGVRLGQRRPATADGAASCFFTAFDWSALAAISRQGHTVVQALRNDPRFDPPPCAECEAAWASASSRNVLPVQVGPGSVAHAGCFDYRQHRWVVGTSAYRGSMLYTWVRGANGGVYRPDKRPGLTPRTVRLGQDYNVRISVTTCPCGWQRSTVEAARDLEAGSELVALHQAVWDPQQCHLIITGDGGGKWVNDRACFGASLVAFVYEGGTAHRLAELSLPLYTAESAQEASRDVKVSCTSACQQTRLPAATARCALWRFGQHRQGAR